MNSGRRGPVAAATEPGSPSGGEAGDGMTGASSMLRWPEQGLQRVKEVGQVEALNRVTVRDDGLPPYARPAGRRDDNLGVGLLERLPPGHLVFPGDAPPVSRAGHARKVTAHH